MAVIPLLLLLPFAADASSKTSISYTNHHHKRERRKWQRSTAIPSAFQGLSHCGNKSERNDSFSLHDRIYTTHQMAGRLERNSGLFAIDPSNESDLLSNNDLPPLAISRHIDLTPSSFSPQASTKVSRRAALLQILLATSLPGFSSASEIDTTGELFTPKNEMIKGGGSDAARGIRLKPVDEKESRNRKNTSLLKSSGLIQNVYETRFITYLARFLLVFDPAASAWWKKNSRPKNESGVERPNIDSSANKDISRETFAEFAESVEVGLADYFLGPYGSYASVAAAKAGIAAAEPARSTRRAENDISLWSIIGFGKRGGTQSITQTNSAIAKRKSRNAQQEATNLSRQGIRNLFALLKARYTTIEEKQQLAVLFSMISKPELQPVQEIRGLLGEVDNGTIATVELVDLSVDDEEESISDTDYFRKSSRQGGGFSKSDEQIIRVDPPAPLGDEYKPAKIRAVMRPTTRILRIDVIDGGRGYPIAPDVIIEQRGVSRPCDACAIIDRDGSVSEIIVLNPGFGYGGQQVRKGLEPNLPAVEIRERKLRQTVSRKEVKPAKAVSVLEYKVVGVDIIDGGTGYLFDQPPEVSLDLPQSDPDWFASPTILGQTDEDDENQLILASVTEMKSGTNGLTLDTRAVRKGKDNFVLGGDELRSIKKDPIALLPSTIRPQFSKFISDASSNVIENGYYSILSLPPVQPGMALPSSRYRSLDPLFGGIGKAPVTKNAMTLSSNQYFRLALSGAICTVLVRTALNPLELVKTKIQLGNDEEIIQLATKKASFEKSDTQPSPKSKPAIGTTEVIQSLVEVRGPLSIFQSADITFLASIVFGLFGFGATELFRRSFSTVFFTEAAGPNEFLLLAAAGLATLLTCAAAAPFEILRVRSMSTTENQGVKKVFDEFVEQNRLKRGEDESMPVVSTSSTSPSSASAIIPTGLLLDDIKPFWSSFNPIVSRELPFAVTKFLVFDIVAGTISGFINTSDLLGGDEIQVGVGTLGLLLSAFAGALAGIAGAFVSHPADLILTLTSASSREEGQTKDWRVIVQELLAADGGISNLYSGFPARAVFFFLVIGLQFFLYDYIKTLLDVGTDDLTLVLDVFYAVRQGLL